MAIPVQWQRPDLLPDKRLFVGRVPERFYLEQQIQQQRCVVIVGMGGTGKTAFMLHIAYEWQAQYPGGVLWARLGPAAASAQQIWQDWIATHAQAPTIDPSELDAATVQRLLSAAPGQLLACIDDSWDANLVQDLVDSLPDGTHILITARDTSFVPEHLFKSPMELSDLEDGDAVDMLRARLNLSVFMVDDLKKIADILGNHALALSLAAIWLENNGPDNMPRLIQRLERRAGSDNPFKVLQLGDVRDNNLETALSLSYDTLTERQQHRFRMLSIIPAGINYSDAWVFAVWGINTSDEDALEDGEDDLLRLVRASMVQRHDNHYDLHPNLWQYANALRLRASEGETAQQRYITKLRELADMLGDVEEGGIPMERWNVEVMPHIEHLHTWMDELADQIEQWLAANNAPDLPGLTQPEAPGNLPAVDDAIRDTLQQFLDFLTQSGVGNYVYYRRVGEVGLRWLRIGLLASIALNDANAQGYCMGEIGSWHSNRGDLATALPFLEASLHSAQQTTNRSQESIRVNNLAGIYYAEGDYEKALQYFRDAHSIMQEIGERAGEGTALNNPGMIHNALGDDKLALHCYNDALAISRESGNRVMEAVILNNIGSIHANRFDSELALQFYADALAIQAAVGDIAGEATTGMNTGDLLHNDLGRSVDAIPYLLRAVEIMEHISSPNLDKTRELLDEARRSIRQ